MQTAVLYLDSGDSSNEVHALVDECVPLDSPKEQILRALKRLTTAVPARRARTMMATIESREPLLTSCSTYEQVCRETADAAVFAGAEFAAVCLIDRGGTLYRSERPNYATPLAPAMPANFLSGYATIRSKVDADFFRETFDDTESIEAIAARKPHSGASIPIVDAGRVAGTLFALTFSYRFSQDHAAGLMQLCEIAGRALGTIPDERRAPAPVAIRGYRSTLTKRSADSARRPD
jgi:hypothetical protein